MNDDMSGRCLRQEGFKLRDLSVHLPRASNGHNCGPSALLPPASRTLQLLSRGAAEAEDEGQTLATRTMADPAQLWGHRPIEKQRCDSRHLSGECLQHEIQSWLLPSIRYSNLDVLPTSCASPKPAQSCHNPLRKCNLLCKSRRTTDRWLLASVGEAKLIAVLVAGCVQSRSIWDGIGASLATRQGGRGLQAQVRQAPAHVAHGGVA
mmetsp:Transcript_104127/g.333939  ORF Transcript_104127/g.333939 Transcript_104127/m.333939 type:complete len:207 (-) Transcript_104127:374-994(-)